MEMNSKTSNCGSHENCAISSCNSSVSQTLDEMDFERGIWHAAQTGDLPRVEYLVETKGVSPNARDLSGYVALHYASRGGHVDVCKHLIEAGADVNLTTRAGKATPLHRAASCGKTAVIQLLLGKKQGHSELDLECVDDTAPSVSSPSNPNYLLSSSSSSGSSLSQSDQGSIAGPSSLQGYVTPQADTAQLKVPARKTLSQPYRDVSKEGSEIISEGLVNMIALDMLLLSFCENEGFRRFMYIVKPAYKIPTRHTIEKIIEKVWKDLQTKVAAELREAGSVALALDGWTSVVSDSYQPLYKQRLGSYECYSIHRTSVGESHWGKHCRENLRCGCRLEHRA